MGLHLESSTFPEVALRRVLCRAKVAHRHPLRAHLVLEGSATSAGAVPSGLEQSIAGRESRERLAISEEQQKRSLTSTAKPNHDHTIARIDVRLNVNYVFIRVLKPCGARVSLRTMCGKAAGGVA